MRCSLISRFQLIRRRSDATPNVMQRKYSVQSPVLCVINTIRIGDQTISERIER